MSYQGSYQGIPSIRKHALSFTAASPSVAMRFMATAAWAFRDQDRSDPFDPME